jgi:hypothetical protein
VDVALLVGSGVDLAGLLGGVAGPGLLGRAARRVRQSKLKIWAEWVEWRIAYGGIW